MLGYEIYPMLLPKSPEVKRPPQQGEVAIQEEEAIPKPIAPEPTIELIPKPKVIAKEEPKPITPLEPEPEGPSVAKSPLESANLILVGRSATSSGELQNDKDLMFHASYNGEWEEYRSLLSRSLNGEFSNIRQDHSDRRYDKMWSENKYYTACLRWKLLGEFPYEILNSTKKNQDSANLLTWILNNDEAMEEILLTLNENDDKQKVFAFLSKIWSNKPLVSTAIDKDSEEPESSEELFKLKEKYFNLALACAVVFDNDISYTNTQNLSASSAQKESLVDGFMRYSWYIKKNEGGLLEGDIHRASARDLTFVVCSPVSNKELEWALKKYRSSSRKSFGKAYSDVEYLMERAVEGLNPYEEYTLQEILKHGGICGDQSYFCVNVARAAGIPAFTLTGVTDSGAHAWAAVKIKDDEWATTIGRIGGVSKGQGHDPHTGETITEQDVWMWSSKKVQSRTNVVKVFKHLWLADYFTSIANNDEYSAATTIANNIGKEFPITWRKVYQMMLLDETLTATPELSETVKRWQNFVKDLVREFKENPRMGSIAIEIEDKHIFPYADLKDLRRDLARERRRKTRDASEQSDLVASSIKRETELLLSKEQDDALVEIHQLYSRALRDYGGSITGFDDMSQYYFSIMKQDQEMAEKAVRTIELAFGRMIESGTDDWFRLNTEVGIQRKIANMYREVNNDKKADILDKKLDRMLKNAKRKAL